VETIEEIEGEKWDKVMAINLKGTYLCCREALRLMKARSYGKIVNVSSIAGRIGGITSGINYSTSKGAIITMTMALAKAAAPFGINVNAVAPGFINTQMAKKFTHFVPESVPLKRIREPEDVADVILFLASEMSRYITGCIIDVNGGVYMS
jgi:3-oxoacyl-[acyl-carrier protein] reductase